jgi:spore maturation protein CgeB
MDDCGKLVKYYLNHNEERETIARAGFLHVSANYTYDQVINPIINKYVELSGKC